MTIFGSGHQVVTSTTRPTSPIAGQVIYETDTFSYRWFNGLTWEGVIPIGSIQPFAGATAPGGWLFCDGGKGDGSGGGTINGSAGQPFADLWSVIGNTYNASGTQSAFYLPDLRGRAPFGKETTATKITSAVSGINGAALGAVGGDQNVHNHNHGGTTGNDSPDHSHSTNQTSLGETAGMYHRTGNFVFGSGDTGGAGGAGSNLKAVPSGGASARHAHSISSFGIGASQNMPPTIIVNYIIKY